ncbi:hypothetical protein KI688_002933 [Linnemannia hyalina]|uniref:Uncharacterized protein n=1 Tax=Linnemannia hyalina TaxID=64524 RepID=A0A9P8BQR2_9FUNG|nr:hypothetical protein KI688_002933 [Linnemannia hyalina]
MMRPTTNPLSIIKPRSSKQRVTRSTTTPSPPPIGRHKMPLPAAAEAANNHSICNYNNTASNHQGDTHTTTNQDRATPKHPDLDDMIRDDKPGRALRKARWERHYPIVEGEMAQEKSVDSDM